jgi:LytS/YehU family sensor histidine kinase
MTWIDPSRAAGRTLAGTLAQSFIFESIAFWCLLGVVHAIVFYERFQNREVQAAELKAQLAASQLESLSAQLHPHFLFNTLQGISTLMHRDPRGADTMLSRLSELLRRTLQRGDRQEVRLSEEMELLGYYVGIMRVRFGDRLVFESDIDPSLTNALVPHFILQPLVENALQYGLARRAGAGRITVTGERSGASLILRIRDDGPGPGAGPSDPVTEGIGLGNTRRRLEGLYGTDQRLTLTPSPGGGMLVELVLPWRESTA